MFDMTENEYPIAEITPPAVLPNLLPIAAEWGSPYWWDNTPTLGFFPIEFRQQWEYRRYVYVDDTAPLAQYRFIGDNVPTKSGVRETKHSHRMPGTDTGTLLHLERIVRADWLYTTDNALIARAYQATRTPNGITLAKVTGTEEVPPWPENTYKPPAREKIWWDAVPRALRRYLLPIYDNCSGNTLPAGFYQVTLQYKEEAHEYLYIDVPEDTLASWALLGNLEKDWERAGSSFLDVQCIAKHPLNWGEAIAHTLYREPSTGMLGIRPFKPNPHQLIRGQLVTCKTDIVSEFSDEPFAWKGDTLVICKPAGEQDTYNVEHADTERTFFGRVHRDTLNVLDGQFKQLRDID